MKHSVVDLMAVCIDDDLLDAISVGSSTSELPVKDKLSEILVGWRDEGRGLHYE